MPLTRYQIRNEYSLADPELYKAADRDDPEALLEGVAMAGLIGVLRQLGDLAEFAAEIFHDLHEEVMSTAARGHGLMVRVQQLEAEFPSIEKAFLSQTNHSTFFSNAGVDWHPNMQMKQNLITGGDLPRCVMDSYEECRGPPRLFLLDKFDVAGAGACLKRYTDPSLFKVEVAPSGRPLMEVQREKRMRKVKKKGSRWRNGETPEMLPTSHAKLHELFLEETIEKNYANPARLVKLKKRQLNASPFDPRSGKSYMEKFLESPTENNVVREISVTPIALKLASDNSSESGPEIHDISTVSPVKKSSRGKESTPPNPRELVLNSSINESYKEVIDGQITHAPGLLAYGETDETSSHNATVEKDIAVDGKGQADCCLGRDRSDDMTSEVDNYVDALTSVESEMETDNEYRSGTDHGYLSVGRRGEDFTRNEEQMDSQANSWDSRSIGNFSASDDGSSSFKKEISSLSYSDTPSNMVENTHSDGERASARVVPSETSMSEITEMPSNQLPANMQILGTNSHDLELLNNGCVDEDNGHGLAEESSNYCAKSSSLLRSDPAASLELHRVDETLQQHTYNEKHSVCMISGFELASINEDATDLVDSSTVTDMALLRTKDDGLSTACASHPVDRSDGEHPDVTSDTLLNNSNNLKLAPEKKNHDDSVGEELQSDFAGEKCMENMVHDRTRNINSSLSTATATEEQSHFSAASESDTHVDVRSLPDSTDVMNSDKSVSHLDEASRLTGIYAKNLMSMDDASETLKGELLSDTAENLPSVELDSTEKERVYSMGDVNPDTTGIADCVELESTEKPLPYSEEVADLEDGEKIGFLTCKVDKVEEDDVPLEFPSSSPACSALEDNVGIDHVVAVSIHTEKTVVSATTAATATLMTAGTGDEDYTDVICQPPTLLGSQSGNLVKMPESSVTENQHQKEPEVSELFLSESFRASEEEREKDQLKVVPNVLPSTSFKLVSNEDSNVEMVDGTQESSVAHTTEIYLRAGDINIASASSELEATSSPTAHHLPDPETSSEQLLDLQASQSGIEDLKTDQANSKWSDDPYHIALQRCYDDASESYRGISSEVLPCEVLELQADQSDMQNLKTDHANSEPSDDLYHIAQERCYSDASESYGGFSRQLLLSQHLKPSTLEQFNSTGPALSPASSVLPSIDMFHEAPQVSLEEIPPLPPLPPMQWRLGKIQPAPPVSEKEFVNQSQEPIPSTSPLKHDEQTQFGYPDPQRGIGKPGNLFLQVAAAEVEKSENESETMVGNIMQHNMSSSQLPTDAKQKNPSLESSDLSDEKPEHGFSALESEVVPSSSNPFLPAATHIEYYNLKDDTISLQGSEVQPPSKITLETGLVGKVLENTSQSLEQEQGNTSDPSVSPTKEVEEQSQHGLLTSEEEPAWTSNPFLLLPTLEAGMPNGSSKTKIPRPRNPLIDAVAAHDKSKLRKVTERVLPQSEPKVDERDSLLEQIRTKSFNLKPAVVSRPSMPGPTPNLKLAAILEKANAIRHATAGSDEDSDSWSDS